MPTLHWIGKDKVINHHHEVPFRVLNQKDHFASSTPPSTSNSSGNKIIHGDNLEALKSLLPEYEGKIKCIYIDPPYNTGKEGWIYNDNVNHPKIKSWLGKVVGEEGDDLTRHDKWLCMMYPRLALLQRLLSQDGLIFISIDDIELQSLRYICDDIFGSNNFVSNFTWRTDGNFDNQAKIKINHEYVVCYSKDISLFGFPKVVDPNVEESSKLFKTEIVNTIVKNGSKNPISPVDLPSGFPAQFEKGFLKERNDAFPKFKSGVKVSNFQTESTVTVESGWSSKRQLELFINNSFEPVLDTKGQKTKFYLTENGAIESLKIRDDPSHVISSLMNLGSTQSMSAELKLMGIQFSFPKPTALVKYLISTIQDSNAIILDSFAGSGTTAQAVLNLNVEDGGNRKFILIEMEDYAETITAKRVRSVMNGYGGKNGVAGTGGAFDYYELGAPLFLDDGPLTPAVATANIRRYVWYTETRAAFPPSLAETEDPYLGTFDGTAYWFLYHPTQETTLDYKFLATVSDIAEQYLVYADNCLLSPEYLAEHDIVFKKIPRDLSRC
jgi:adenine-specific DNA-methyltransferase